MVIELPSELEHQLQQVACERGVPVADLVRSALESLVGASMTDGQSATPLSSEERAARVDAAVGVIAHLPGSVDDFLRRKQEEIDLSASHHAATSDFHRLTREERLARIDSILGKYSGLQGSVDEFLKNKREDTEQEEERLERRRSGAAE